MPLDTQYDLTKVVEDFIQAQDLPRLKENGYELQMVFETGCATSAFVADGLDFIKHQIWEPYRHLFRDAEIIILFGEDAVACDKPSLGG